jgi:23S rRNA pseudouridine1911/1915/1917 synthase
VPGPLVDRRVPAGEAGARLDAVLARWLAEPRARAQRRIADGEVTVDGAVVSKSHRLEPGERVQVVEGPPPEPPPAPEPVPVRWRDEHLLVVAKPAGLVVHPGAGVDEGTLVHALEAMGEELAPGDDPDRPGVVHRLDRGTSGLLIVARTEVARSALQQALAERAVRRRYWALVEGVPRERAAVIDAPIVRHPRKRTVFTTGPEGRPALTRYEITAEHSRAAELDVGLETGRTHQVRVHLSAIGHPVCGDRAYGASPLGEQLGLERPALHAARISFQHPVTGQPIEVTEPLPEDLRAAVAALTGDQAAHGL